MRKKTWEDRAACAPQNRTKQTEDLDWFTNDKDEKYKARAVCQGACPVRQECLQAALDAKMLHGIWGGVDDYEIRRAMSVDALGEPRQRNRVPRCPFCMSRSISVTTPKTKQGFTTECLDCGLTWQMATIPQKLKQKKVS